MNKLFLIFMVVNFFVTIQTSNQTKIIVQDSFHKTPYDHEDDQLANSEDWLKACLETKNSKKRIKRAIYYYNERRKREDEEFRREFWNNKN